MSDDSAQHSTLVLARTFAAPIGEVFAAFADPDRARIFSGSEQLTITYERADLRVGGADVFRFGRGDDLCYRGETHYHDVVPERRIVYTDVVSDENAPVWVAAVTLEFTRADKCTQVKLTVQSARLDGATTQVAASGRYSGLLENLERHLDGTLRFRPRTVTPD